jgi:hypothetical protein
MKLNSNFASNKFNLILKLNSFNYKNAHVIACRSVVVRGFSSKEEVVAAELGGQPREVSQMLTFFL